MKVQIKPGFLFPTQFWTAELSENIEQLQNEAFLIRNNDKDGVRKSNSATLANVQKYSRIVESV